MLGIAAVDWSSAAQGGTPSSQSGGSSRSFGPTDCGGSGCGYDMPGYFSQGSVCICDHLTAKKSSSKPQFVATTCRSAATTRAAQIITKQATKARMVEAIRKFAISEEGGFKQLKQINHQTPVKWGCAFDGCTMIVFLGEAKRKNSHNVEDNVAEWEVKWDTSEFQHCRECYSPIKITTKNIRLSVFAKEITAHRAVSELDIRASAKRLAALGFAVNGFHPTRQDVRAIKRAAVALLQEGPRGVEEQLNHLHSWCDEFNNLVGNGLAMVSTRPSSDGSQVRLFHNVTVIWEASVKLCVQLGLPIRCIDGGRFDTRADLTMLILSGQTANNNDCIVAFCICFGETRETVEAMFAIIAKYGAQRSGAGAGAGVWQGDTSTLSISNEAWAALSPLMELLDKSNMLLFADRGKSNCFGPAVDAWFEFMQLRSCLEHVKSALLRNVKAGEWDPAWLDALANMTQLADVVKHLEFIKGKNKPAYIYITERSQWSRWMKLFLTTAQGPIIMDMYTSNSNNAERCVNATKVHKIREMGPMHAVQATSALVARVVAQANTMVVEAKSRGDGVTPWAGNCHKLRVHRATHFCVMDFTTSDRVCNVSNQLNDVTCQVCVAKGTCSCGYTARTGMPCEHLIVARRKAEIGDGDLRGFNPIFHILEQENMMRTCRVSIVNIAGLKASLFNTQMPQLPARHRAASGPSKRWRPRTESHTASSRRPKPTTRISAEVLAAQETMRTLPVNEATYLVVTYHCGVARTQWPQFKEGGTVDGQPWPVVVTPTSLMQPVFVCDGKEKVAVTCFITSQPKTLVLERIKDVCILPSNAIAHRASVSAQAAQKEVDQIRGTQPMDIPTNALSGGSLDSIGSGQHLLIFYAGFSHPEGSYRAVRYLGTSQNPIAGVSPKHVASEYGAHYRRHDTILMYDLPTQRTRSFVQNRVHHMFTITEEESLDAQTKHGARKLARDCVGLARYPLVKDPSRMAVAEVPTPQRPDLRDMTMFNGNGSLRSEEEVEVDEVEAREEERCECYNPPGTPCVCKGHSNGR